MSTIEVLEKIAWPDHPTVESLAQPIADASGFDMVAIHAIPPDLGIRGLSGMTVANGRIAKVFYDMRLTALNRKQTILHEYAHILHGDLCGRNIEKLHRTAFSDPMERRAESTGMMLLAELQRRTRVQSDVLSFMSGNY